MSGSVLRGVVAIAAVCVVVAGVFGAATVNKRILVVAAVPAAIALVAVALS